MSRTQTYADILLNLPVDDTLKTFIERHAMPLPEGWIWHDSIQASKSLVGLIQLHPNAAMRDRIVAVVVPWHIGARSRQCANHTGCGAGQGSLLATVGRHATERAAGETDQPFTRWLRRQTYQQQMGRYCQMLARLRIARYHPVAGAGGAQESAWWRAQHEL